MLVIVLICVIVTHLCCRVGVEKRMGLVWLHAVKT